MKLNDYAKSTRRGREANRVEREAMSDPFLSDAIEGLDAVYANHTDILAQLENRVAKLSKKKRKVRPLPTEVDALAAPGVEAADAMPSGESDAQPKSSPEAGTSGARADRKIKFARGMGAFKKDKGDNEKASETDKKSAGGAEIPENGQKPPTKSGKRNIRLFIGIAAVFVLCAAGTAWLYFGRTPQDSQTKTIAQKTDFGAYSPEISGPEFSEGTIVEEQEILPEPITDVARKPAAAEQTAKADEKHKARIESQPQSPSQPEPQKSTAKFTPPVIVADEDIKEDAANEDRMMFIDELSMSKVLDTKITGLRQDTAKKANDIGEPTMTPPAIAAAAKADVPSSHLSGSAPDAGVLSSRSASEAQSAEPKDRISVVVNSEFNKYFEANAKPHTDSEGNPIVGKVIAEFRVNAQGVPSGVRIISSPKIDMGREVVQLLVSGPRWEPTHGKRIRAEVEYK